MVEVLALHHVLCGWVALSSDKGYPKDFSGLGKVGKPQQIKAHGIVLAKVRLAVVPLAAVGPNSVTIQY